MENWTITPLGHFSTSATRTFGPYTVIVVASLQCSSWRIDVGGIEIARSTAPLGAKTIDVAIERATTQIKALIDALAPFSALATQLAEAEAVIASTRALLTEAEAALARQEARIAELEAEADADADAATIAHLEAHLSRADKRLARYVRAKEQSVMGAEDANEEGGQ
jgi:septal ring factor EnvC (AmiA/AmiB activator)